MEGSWNGSETSLGITWSEIRFFPGYLVTAFISMFCHKILKITKGKSFEIVTQFELIEQFISKAELCRGSMTFYCLWSAFFIAMMFGTRLLQIFVGCIEKKLHVNNVNPIFIFQSQGGEIPVFSFKCFAVCCPLWHTFLPRQFFTHVSLGSACGCFLTISLLWGFYSLTSFPFLGSRRIFGPLRIWLFIQYLFEFFLEMFCWDSESINLAEHFQMPMATILRWSRKCLHSSQGKFRSLPPPPRPWDIPICSYFLKLWSVRQLSSDLREVTIFSRTTLCDRK